MSEYHEARCVYIAGSRGAAILRRWPLCIAPGPILYTGHNTTRSFSAAMHVCVCVCIYTCLSTKDSGRGAAAVFRSTYVCKRASERVFEKVCYMRDETDDDSIFAQRQSAEVHNVRLRCLRFFSSCCADLSLRGKHA